MTRDKIIRIALEAGLHVATDVNWMPIIGFEYAEKFAKLVLMNTDPNSFMSYQEGAEAGRLAEREACAKVCESRITPGTGSVAILNGAADAIRARSQA
jgi:hypothetical protein